MTLRKWLNLSVSVSSPPVWGTDGTYDQGLCELVHAESIPCMLALIAVWGDKPCCSLHVAPQVDVLET